MEYILTLMVDHTRVNGSMASNMVKVFLSHQLEHKEKVSGMKVNALNGMMKMKMIKMKTVMKTDR